MRATFKDKKGIEKYIDFPIDVSEIEFEDYIDFKQCESDFFRNHVKLPDDVDVSEISDEEIKEFSEILVSSEDQQEYLIEAISHIIKGDIDILPFNIGGDDPFELVAGGYLIDSGDVISTVRLYAHIVTLINQYEPDEIPKSYSFKHKGEIYYIDPEDVQNQLTEKTYNNIEVITLLQSAKAAKQRRESSPGNMNIDFDMQLEEMAVLARKKNEKLPFKRRQRIKFIDSRKEIFRDLSMSTVLLVRFFFIVIIQSLLTTQVTDSFLRENNVQ